MGIYLLAAIVFILFIIFIADLIRDSKDRPFNPNFRLNQFREEFGEEEDFMDYDEEYADDAYFNFDESEIESMNLTTRVDDEFEMNYNEEFAEEPEIVRPEKTNQHIVDGDDEFYRR
jgi:hypothetical protein